MRSLIGLIVVAGIGILVISMYMSDTALADDGRDLAIAFGAPKTETIQIHIGVAPLVPRNDPPSRDGKEIPWDQWVAEHYQIRDENGGSVTVEKIGTSALMQERAAGIPEFSVGATLTKGKPYTCDFIPIFGEPKRYRWSFTAPSDSKKVKMEHFDLVPESGK